QLFQLLAFALRGKRAGQREFAPRGYWLAAAKVSAHGRCLATLLPKRSLGAAAEEPDSWPVGIVRDKCGITIEACAVVVALQVIPFDRFAGDRVLHAAGEIERIFELALADEIERLTHRIEVGERRQLSERDPGLWRRNRSGGCGWSGCGSRR